MTTLPILAFESIEPVSRRVGLILCRPARDEIVRLRGRLLEECADT